MRTVTVAAAARVATAGLAILLLAAGLAWCAAWQSDAELLDKVAGGAEELAPAWPGRGRVRYADLGRAARSRISPGTLQVLHTWADVCRVFADVPDPQPANGDINSIVVPPVPQGDGTVRAHEVVVVRELTGWRLAAIRCSPVRRGTGLAPGADSASLVHGLFRGEGTAPAENVR